MNDMEDPDSFASLDSQRDVLRQRMQQQRELIASQLGPDSADRPAFPRSNTMRFFYQRPGLASKLAIELATLLVGTRVIKSMGNSVGLAKMIHSALNK